MALGLLAWATSIHFSAAPLLLIAAGFIITTFRGNLKRLILALLPMLLICLTTSPSVLDWWDQHNHPRPKPDFVLKFEASMPPPLPWWERLNVAAKAVFITSSIEAVPGIEVAQPGIAAGAVLLDWWVLLVTGTGGLFLLWKLYRRPRPPSSYGVWQFGDLLLAWLILPIIIGGLLLHRVNAGYFFCSSPAVWLLPLYLRNSRWERLLGVIVVATVFGGSVAMDSALLRVIDRSEAMPGSYYIKYGNQLETIKYIVKSGVPPRHMSHMAGDWFGQSYAYLDQCVFKRKLGQASGYALLQDTDLRLGKQRLEMISRESSQWFGRVAVLLFPSKTTAEIWAE
jgi:hypothetical protein